MRGLLYLLSFCVLFFWSMAMLGAVTIGKVENEKSYKAILIGLICLIISLIFWMLNTELVHNKQIPENNEVEKDTIHSLTDALYVAQTFGIKCSLNLDHAYLNEGRSATNISVTLN